MPFYLLLVFSIAPLNKKKRIYEVLLVDNTCILFVEDAKDELCSFKAMKKVHEINCHNGKDQLISAYH